MKGTFSFAALVAVVVAGALVAQDAEPARVLDAERFRRSGGFGDAVTAAQQQNWREARMRFDATRASETDWHSPAMRQAVEGSALCSARLGDWEAAFAPVREYLSHVAGSLEECLAQRFLAGLYDSIPHRGMRRAGTFRRGDESGQGTPVDAEAEDREAAIQLYESARVNLGRLAAAPGLSTRRAALIRAERLGVNFDLATVLLQSPGRSYRNSLGLTRRAEWWLSRSEVDQQRKENDWGVLPLGLPLEAEGRPKFLSPAATYGPGLSDGQKTLFLLREIEEIDTTPKREDAARAAYRRAAIAESIYSQRLAGEWHEVERGDSSREFPPPGSKPLHALDDDEAWVVAQGRLRLLRLPATEHPVALLREVIARYPQSVAAIEARSTLVTRYLELEQQSRAVAELEILAQSPQPKARREAMASLRELRRTQITLAKTTAVLPGSPPKLALEVRNARQVRFNARRLDLATLIGNGTKRGERWEGLSAYALKSESRRLLRGREMSWAAEVPAGRPWATIRTEVEAPLREPGAYLIEARAPGSPGSARVIQVVSEAALLIKWSGEDRLIFLLSARDGAPWAGQPVRVTETSGRGRSAKVIREAVLSTDADGHIRFRPSSEENALHALHEGPDGQLAALGMDRRPRKLEKETAASGLRGIFVFDRPYYRPTHPVRLRLWLREYARTGFQPPRAGLSALLRCRAPDGTPLETRSLVTDEAGGVDVEFALPENAGLGRWKLQLSLAEKPEAVVDSAEFAVEEYRKPEMELIVRPAALSVRLGQPIKVRVEGRYYFGAPAAGARASLRVVRGDYPAFRPEFVAPVGAGEPAATTQLAYPWLPWTLASATDPASRRRTASHPETVVSREVTLGPDGVLEFEFPTDLARQRLGDRDHRYEIEVTLRDASRRSQQTTASAVAVRAEFGASVSFDAPWYAQPGPMQLRVATGSLVGDPLAVAGELTISRLSYAGAQLEEVREEEIARWPIQTNAQGEQRVAYTPPSAGQCRLRFLARDATGERVESNAVCWVLGPGFEAAAHRFKDLEIIPERLRYQPGETARVLVATRGQTRRVLLSENARLGHWLQWRAIETPSRVTIVELPIRPEQIPLVSLEAVAVQDGQMHTEIVELEVPPPTRGLTLKIATDRSEYRPGETGRVLLEARDDAGQPIVGEVAVRATDAALMPLAYLNERYFRLDERLFDWHFHQSEGQSSLGQSYESADSGPPSRQSFPERWPEWRRGSWSLEGYGFVMGGRAFGLSTRPAGSFESPEFARRAARRAVRHSEFAVTPAGDGEPARVIVTGSYIPTAETGPVSGAEDAQRRLAAPVVRSNLADVAVWLPKLVLGPDGRAEAEFRLPQSLTRWDFSGWAITPDTRLTTAQVAVVTTKKVIVRLQAPRFFIERDEVIISSIAHNYLPGAQLVRGELLAPREFFEPILAEGAKSETDAEGNAVLRAEVEVAAGGQHRFDWRLRALRPGQARIAAKALTAEESDAVQMSFPLLVHGVEQQVADSGSLRVGEEGERLLHYEIPASIDPARTRFSLVLRPSLVGVMADALPFLADYPHGCIEQTVNRFYPSVVTVALLRNTGVDLAALQPRAGDPRRAQEFGKSPLTDPTQLQRMIATGLRQIREAQTQTGGWSWWEGGEASIYQTALVLQALQEMRGALPQDELESLGHCCKSGNEFLRAAIKEKLTRSQGQRLAVASAEDAFVALVLAQAGPPDATLRTWLSSLYARRASLNPQGQALLTLALRRAGRKSEAALVLRNLLQFLERDDSNDTAWIRTPTQGWWLWFQNDVETNAWALRALLAVDPQSEVAPRLVKWLVNHRRGGSQWRSTRDTALALIALADYLRLSGEALADASVSVQLDDSPARDLHLSSGGLLGGEERLTFEAAALPPGRHTIRLRKTGRGALYYAARLEYFTQAPDLESAGGDLAVERMYLRIPPRAAPTDPEPVPQPLRSGDHVASGDEIEVVLRVTAKNGYDFLAFEDRKPAGCEPVEKQSGPRSQDGIDYHYELRETKTMFYVEWLAQGGHELRYRLRAETPGVFRAPPATGFGMYAPELRANSRTMRLRVGE